MLVLKILIVVIALSRPPVEITQKPEGMVTAPQAVPVSELTEFERTISAIRKLDFLCPVKYAKMTEDELKAFISEKLDEENPKEEFQNELAAYKALGLLDDISGIRELLLELYTEQIAAFYDQKEHKLFSRNKPLFSGMLNDVVLIHELTHALQDQHFGLEKLIQKVEDNNDKLMALISLVEGDATFVQTQYMIKHRDWKLGEIFGIAFQQQEKFFSAPLLVRETMLFPYEKGIKYVTALHDSNGWTAVNTAYADPPVSSEQILHPEKYLSSRDDPREVSIPDLVPVLGKGWKLVNNNNLGELGIMVLFRRYLGIFRAKKPARGWDGDWYNYYVNGNDGREALIWAVVWDSVKDADEFFTSYRKLVTKKFAQHRLVDSWEKTNSVVWQYDHAVVYIGKNNDRSLMAELPKMELLARVIDKFAGFSLPDKINRNQKQEKP